MLDEIEKTVNPIGSLSCVGVGMCLGSHLSPLSRSYIEKADICFVAVSDGIVEQWVMSLNPNSISLQPFYEEGKSRNKTYREMEEVVLESLRAGKKVCCVFYGHPGVFAQVPHSVVKLARREGYMAIMEPGISAEDCLYADLGIDPGAFGCQHFEASQYLMYKRIIDPTAYLILWQVGVTGDLSLARFNTSEDALNILVRVLSEYYNGAHQVILYEARTLPIDDFRSDKVSLRDLPSTRLNTYTTLIIPPAGKMVPNEEIQDLLTRSQ